jgi:OmpA-OmpF porin, OOP family
MWKRVLLVLVAALFVASRALAQDRTGFAIDRHEPAERGSMFFVVDSLDLRGHVRPAAGATLAYGYKPLVVQDANAEERFALVRHQLLLHAGASVVLIERVRVGLDVPFAIYQDGEDGLAAGDALRGASAPALGDVRLAADARIAGRHGDPITVAAGLRAWLPTGLRSQFTSDGPLRVAPQMLVAGEAGPLAWGARTAVVVRGRDDRYAGASLGSELFAAIGAGLRTRGDRLVIGPELQASSVLAELFEKKTTPIELLGGAHWEVTHGFRIGAGVGLGLTQGFGSPRVRGLFAIEWTEHIVTPTLDRDGDGINDDVDACPREAGIFDEDPARNGCPPPPIPQEDADGDGVFDTEDACPTVAGVRTKDPMTNGCPPNAPRPLAIVTKDQIRIGEEIRFATDSADLLGESDAVLGAVKKILDEHPDIRKVRIEGHTDAVGDPAYNEELSARRAASVTQWLTGHGIDAARLESKGFGSRRPIDTNETEEGRARNRRVVFTITERSPR